MAEKRKLALISGISGMDGSYLSEFLLSKNYIVYGIVRRSSLFNLSRLDNIRNNSNLKLVYGDLTDSSNLNSILSKIKTTMKEGEILEIYNLAAQSHVKVSFEVPEYTAQTSGFGTLNFLEAIRSNNMIECSKFYQASTSEMYGKVQEIPQKETTPFYPRSPYAVAKLYAHWITKNYRESYDMFACSGILFNHSSPRRGENFILRKISLGVAKIVKEKDSCIYLGNLNSKRDIGHSKDYIKGMWMMLQQEKPEDYVLATNKQYSIREFVEMAFDVVHIDIKWRGEGLEEVGYHEKDGKILVRVSEKYFRPAEVDTLLGDYTKAQKGLGWEPETGIRDLIHEMVHNDLLNV
jgi:GDPmannose 4,6-dehydratase